MVGGGSKSAKGGPNPVADMDRGGGGPNPLADLDRVVQIRGGSKSAVTPALIASEAVHFNTIYTRGLQTVPIFFQISIDKYLK